ncbi:MAG: ACT domain-containing protein [Pseudomonadota bacterium]
MASPIPGERDLTQLLTSMSPRLNPGCFVFITLSADDASQIEGVLMRFEEAEGTTLILSRERAEALGLDYTFPSCWITLSVASALDAVGFIAEISAALSDAGISTNPVAGYHHDHLFVPEDDVETAMATLEKLSAARG